MTPARICAGLLFGALLVANAAAIAAERNADSSAANGATPAADVTMWQYGLRERQCLEWTDGCRVCRRTGPNQASCSNVGTACLQGEIRCTSRQGDESK
jgi:hypothetical protein